MEEYITLIKPCLGKQVIAIARIHYVYKDHPNFETGSLELKFAGNLTLHLTGKGDGEKLHIRNEPWQDPFAEPLSVENQEFLQKHGKWTLFDVSDQPPYERCLRQRLERVHFIRNRSGAIVGLEMSFREQALNFIVDGDEAYVIIEDGVTKLGDIGFAVDHSFYIGSV